MLLLSFFFIIGFSFGVTVNIFTNINSLLRNNACPTYYDYYLLKINPRCHFNPDVTPDFGVLLSRYFKSFTLHTVTTEDGYILNVYQIPQKNPKGVIIMQNAMGTDAIQFIITGKTSYAYFFYQQGYEIWLSSTRGTQLSPDHISMSQSDPEFWKWSYEETGKYDTRSVINYVRREIGPDSKLIFIGHSQSGGEGLIYASLYPKEAKENVDLFVLLAPASFYLERRSPVVMFSELGIMGLDLLTMVGKHSVTQQNSIETIIGKFLFKTFPLKRLEFLLVDIGSGWAPSQDDPNLFYLCLATIFRGTSVQNAKYYLQQAKSKKFQMFDYGRKKNLKLYGKEQPPEYPLEDIKAPVYVFAGRNDGLVTQLGIKVLSSRLSVNATIYGGPQFIDNYNHVDFAIGKDRVAVYKKILKVLQKL